MRVCCSAQCGADAGTIEAMASSTAPKRSFRLPVPPLWLLGVVEAVQAVLATALLVAVPVLAMTLAGGFSGDDPVFIMNFSAQIWLIVHGVPVELALTAGAAAIGAEVLPETGWMHLVPLGFTLIPLALGWRAGARLARGSYANQLWQGLLPLVLLYGAAGAGMGVLGTAGVITVSPLTAGLCAAAVMMIGALAGCYAEARSATRMIGVDLESAVERFSQRMKWAGYYLWAVARAGVVASIAAVGLAAALFAGFVAASWMDVANAYQQLDPGFWGVVGLTLLHLGLLPNLILWMLAYATGAGFSVGEGSVLAPGTADVAAMPAVPVLAGLPDQTHPMTFAVIAVPVLAGAIAGWWLMREGENHLDDFFALRISFRPASLALSTLLMGILTGLIAALLMIGPLWISHISLGIGRLSDIGPNALISAGMLAVWVGLGAVVGHMLAPLAHQRGRRRKVSAEGSSAEGASAEGASAEGLSASRG